MCGILAFVSKDSRYPVTQKHLELACNGLHPRGPDYCSVQKSHNSSILVVNTVLSINQQANLFKFPRLEENEFFAYNGEIYSTSNYTATSGQSDTHYLLEQLRASRYDLKWLYSASFRGCFALLYINTDEAGNIELIYGNDFFGERNLFVYEDSKQLILSSVPSLCYKLSRIYAAYRPTINRSLISSYIRSRNLLDQPGSFIDEVDIVEPGSITKIVITPSETRTDSVHNSWNPAYIDQLMKSYNKHLDRTLLISASHFNSSADAAASLVISGGVDSSLVAANAHMQRSQNDIAITLTFGARDSVAYRATALVEKLNISRHIVHDVSINEYADSMSRCFQLLLSPLPTHSYPSTYILGHLASAHQTRIIYGGDGADELHIGYPQYLHTLNRRGTAGIFSPYSTFEGDSELSLLRCKDIFSEADVIHATRSRLSRQFVEVFLSHGMGHHEAEIKASLVMDIRYNLHSTGLLAGDLLISNSSVESRSPFVFLQSFLRLLCEPLSTPISRCKPMLADSFTMIFGMMPFEKQGFSGFPNEAGVLALGSSDSSRFPRMSSLYGYDISSLYKSMSRRLRWKMLNCEMFLRHLTDL